MVTDKITKLIMFPLQIFKIILLSDRQYYRISFYLMWK